ncbi:TetR/AcrR family transcriptional regulator [Paenibacillus cucumis (ex Kampfer et al. 2016)]|uniref:TetR/AcrR family transcriptional regulator n=1 Tax=Paenibacillus cucumis (ex Kampfer et al. 2016) TaxID=1776858 RepID=A0ABS7KGR0_9BACL|nr:TetR/AcrR family transcriptional regulator [Paenibacillus cucumis (ex Kampfer et al. 2016)]MBY0203141.1 TetR/AcrR family transcriptional regulator [Paenibacillus cucumis (ex Kampfer et al. 2016)]
MSEQKKKIITAARNLFHTKGFSETSMNQIIEASESSKGNLYHHFKNKENLFVFILEEDANHWLEDWKQEVENTQADSDHILYVLADYIAKSRGNLYYHKTTAEFYSSAFKSDEITEKIKEIDKLYLDFFVNIIKECQAVNQINPGEDPKLLGYFLMSLLFISNDYKHYSDDVEVKENNYNKKAIDIFLKGVN